MSIQNILDKVVNSYAQKTALICGDQQITYEELSQNALKLANVLQSQGIQKSDKIGFYLPNTLELCYSYLACFIIGATGVPLDYMLKEDELTSCLGHSECKAVIYLPKKSVDFDQILKNVPTLKVPLALPEMGALMAQASADKIDVDIQPTDPALIMYTSGTTGRPKGIMLNYSHLEGSPKAMEYFVDLTDKDIKIAAIPLTHIGGFIYLQNCIHFGITVILIQRFNPFEFLECVTRYKVTCFHIVPPMYNAILTLKQIDKFDLSSLRWVVVFGAPSSPEIMERFHKYCPNAKLLNGWGMTETCPPNTVTPMDSDNIKSIGKPAPDCEIKIFDDNDKEVGIGQIGEIVIRGWIVMDGYYKDPDSTAETIKDGWLHTGDLGRVDDEGFFYIVGRKKEMIKVGGQIVYAPEVESVLYKNEEVVEAAVIGIEDKMKGEVIKAFVVLKEGSVLKPEDLRYFTREHLANFKVPQSVEVRAELPKNRTGKIDKNLLKQEVTA